MIVRKCSSVLFVHSRYLYSPSLFLVNISPKKALTRSGFETDSGKMVLFPAFIHQAFDSNFSLFRNGQESGKRESRVCARKFPLPGVNLCSKWWKKSSSSIQFYTETL